MAADLVVIVVGIADVVDGAVVVMTVVVALAVALALVTVCYCMLLFLLLLWCSDDGIAAVRAAFVVAIQVRMGKG